MRNSDSSEGRFVPGHGVELLPDDEFDQRLIQEVAPPGWVNPTPSGKYDLVVIGAGTAGLVTSAGAAGLGARVALIERHLMGGDCLNSGCVPSKALLCAARAASAVRRAGDYGLGSDIPGQVDFGAVMSRMRRLRASMAHHDSARRFTQLGVDVYRGAAAFTTRGTVNVDGRELSCRKAVICTGARAAVPDIPGLHATGFLTNENLFTLTQLPPRLAVIGGGPIGCEMAQAFARLGSQVTLYEAGGRLLPRDHERASAVVDHALRSDGVQVTLGARVERVFPSVGGRTVEASVAGVSLQNEHDAILVAVGRTPNVQELNLEAVGVRFDSSGVQVDDRLRTTNRSIFAAGDVCFPYQFTHAADALARIVVQNALFFGRATTRKLVIPWCTYTSPEVAHVGLTPEAAEERGVKIRTFVQELSQVDRAILDGEEAGFAMVHVKQGTDRILGGTVVASHAGDLISEITLAIRHGIGLKGLATTIHPYPTQGEAIRKLGDQYQRTRLTPWTKTLLKGILKLG